MKTADNPVRPAKSNKPAGRRRIPVAAPAVMAALALGAVLAASACDPKANADWSRVKSAAIALEARGLYAAALDEYDRYRRGAWSAMTEAEEAALLNKMGEIADRELGDCDRALKYYTMATALDGDAEWAAEAGQRSVVCLEKIGRSRDSKALLKQLTDYGGAGENGAANTGGEANNGAGETDGADGGEDGDTNPAGRPAGRTGPVVALIDGESVYWGEVERAMTAKYGDEALADMEKRKAMTRDYVLSSLLLRESRRKDYENEAGARELVELARREALAAYYFKREGIDPSDQEQVSERLKELANLHEVAIYDGEIPEP